jgi:hypothetical protein
LETAILEKYPEYIAANTNIGTIRRILADLTDDMIKSYAGHSSTWVSTIEGGCAAKDDPFVA